LYLDSAYIAKFYVNEADSTAVRALIAGASTLVCSELALAEVPCVFHRHFREGSVSFDQCRELCSLFERHAAEGFWILFPIRRPLLQRAAERIADLPQDVFLRAGDVVHLASAALHGEPEIWTNDRRMLAAAPHFGIRGRSL
jgi:predicted nucleic acid-binding protein